MHRIVKQDMTTALGPEGVPGDADALRQYDFRDEAEALRKMMFADPQAGMAFRTLKDKLTSGSNPQEIVKKLTKDKK